MATGSQVRSAIESRIAAARSAEQSAASALDAVLEDIQREEQDVREAVTRIAALRHDAAASEALQALGAMDDALTDVAESKRSRLAAMDQERGDLVARIERAQVDRARLAASLERAQADRDSAVAAVLAEVAATQRYRDLDQQCEALAADADALGAEIQALDVAASTFRQGVTSRVHDYLRTAGFGSPQYAGNWLVQRLDVWLANRSGFVEVRLREALYAGQRQGVLQRRQALEEAIEGVEAKQQALAAEAVAASSAAALVEAARIADGALQQADDTLEDLHAARSRTEADRHALASGRDADSVAVKHRLADALSTTSDALLRRAAAETATTEDDRLVKRIVASRAKLQALSAQREDAEQVVARAAAVRKEAEEVLRRLRSRSLLSSDSRYRGVDAGSLLEGVLAGALSAADAAARLERAHRIEEPYRPSPSRSSSSSSFGGGGFGGGGFSSGGGFGGGGHSTGGGF